jgi:hypothetical protein
MVLVDDLVNHSKNAREVLKGWKPEQMHIGQHYNREDS